MLTIILIMVFSLISFVAGMFLGVFIAMDAPQIDKDYND